MSLSKIESVKRLMSNVVQRKRSVDRIIDENRKFLTRLQSQKSQFSVSEWHD